MAAKLSAIIFAVIISITLLTVGILLATGLSMDAPFTMYASNTTGSIGANDYGSLMSIAPSTGTGTLLEIESAAGAGDVAMGNSSVILLSTLGLGGVKAVTNNTVWTFNYYGIANVTNKANFEVTATIVFPNGTVRQTLCTNDADGGLIQDTNTTTTGTVTITSATALTCEETDYLKIDWKVRKADGTKLLIDLLIDTDGAGAYTDVSNVTMNYGMSSTFSSLFIIVGIVAMFAIVLYVVNEASKRK